MTKRIPQGIKNNSSRIIIFIVEAICMILELCSSYLLYPYFGNSNTIWTAIITVILLSNCLGNILGGKICESAKKTNKQYTGLIFFFISVCISGILGLHETIIFLISKMPLGNNISAFLCSLILFLPCETLLGTIPPQIMYNESTKENYNANKTGLIYALSTMGGLFGTVLGGFVLVPLIGCKYIITICILTSLILALIHDPHFYKTTRSVVCFLISLSVILMTFISNDRTNWETESHSNLIVDSQYNRIVIQNDIDNNGDKIRDMIMASGYESATYLEQNKRNDLIFDYLKSLDKTIYKNNQINSVTSLMIGGAAYQFPKYLISHYPDKKMTVVEIDKKVTELAKRYFFLQDCINKYDPNNERLKLVNDDGRVFINNNTNSYNIIYNDAFSGTSPIATLSTKEFMISVKEKLNSDGIYAMNIISPVKGDEKRFLCSECNTLSQVFANIYIVKCTDTEDTKRQNLLVIASDKSYNFENTVNLDYSHGYILTDDYCPVEYLSTR